MNDHVPDSTGLPLRAMVMVLLFLGVIFLLLGFQAMGSDDDSDDTSVATATTTSETTATSTSKPAAAKPDVMVFNISEPKQDGLANATKDRLEAEGWKVIQVGDLTLDWVHETTVFFQPDVEDQEAAARDVARLLGTDKVVPRTVTEDNDIVGQPAGVIVAVAG